MKRHFNTTGPNTSTEHYCIDPFSRIDWYLIRELIEAKKFFVLHAPRQTGKTTVLEAIVDRLNREGRYDAMRFSVHSGQPARHDYSDGIRTIVNDLLLEAEWRFPNSWIALEGPSNAEKSHPGSMLSTL
ncbi:MAG: ATP-binding protein, partial [Polyangiaceae bacterium]|nr:ATP-binding protein [Polyangiaceae bacterium]